MGVVIESIRFSHLVGSSFMPGSMTHEHSCNFFFFLSFFLRITASNNLAGSLPEELGDLLALEHISFYNNELVGTLPHRLILLTNLWFLQLEDNELSGSIPDEYFTQLTSLEYLGLSHNHFNSTLPRSIMKLSSLMEIDLSHNELTGDMTVFDSSTDCPPKLKLVYLSDNELTGRIHEASFNFF